MSKKRPRILYHPQKARSAYWRHRLFHNSYTYRGRRRRLRAWSVKIQHRRRRRTFSLQARSAGKAAQEAGGLYAAIVAQGWRTALASQAGLRPLSGRTAKHGPVKAAYWKPRLIQRKYTESLGPSPANEFSVRIEYRGRSHYFPLESREPDRAAAQAALVYRTLAAKGWTACQKQFRREITVAVFWSMHPLATTYTTLFSEPFPTVSPAPAPDRSLQPIGVVEPEEAVSQALVRCLNRQTGFRSVPAWKSGAALLRSLPSLDVPLLLINRALPDMPAAECVAQLARRRPHWPVFTYGVYADSDQLFLSFSGVSAGYILRRRPPHEIVAPLMQTGRRAPVAAAESAHLIKRYFQRFFETAPVSNSAPELALLTTREQEIVELLGKGYVDKEIASVLRISAWTVRGHLKSIFEKLRVHNRTEAVVKYLQK